MFAVFVPVLRSYIARLYLFMNPKFHTKLQIANETGSAELAIIISYTKSASGTIVLLQMPPKYRKID